MSTDLSDGTRERLAALFDESRREEVAELLRDECAGGPLGLDDDTPEGLERIRYAVMKLSAGDFQTLRDEVLAAQLDWRDVLVAAGFGDDPEAHRAWTPGG